MHGIKFLSSGALTALLLLLGASGCDSAVHSRPQRLTPLEVHTAQVRLQPIAEQTELSGTVSSLASAGLTARVTAQILEVSVDQGDRVRQGQLLVRLDDRELRAGVSKVEAAGRELALVRQETEAAIQAARSNRVQTQSALTLAEATFQRFRRLVEREAVSQQEFDEVKAKRDGAQAAVDGATANLESLLARSKQLDAREAQIQADRTSAETRLGFTQIRAPFSGVVLARHVDPGDLASPSVPLLTLERPSYRLEVEVEESLLGDIRVGQRLQAQISSLTEPLTGVVSQIAPGADPRTRTTRVKIDLPEHAGLRSGLFGRVRLTGEAQQVLTMPSQALVERGQLKGAFVIQESRAAFRVLRLGEALDDRRVVLSGLSDADEVILEPSTEIRDGTPVRVVSREVEEPS